jgi:1,4-alpha-glucan branching enzyme
MVQPSASSWGDSGHWGVWLDPKNAWIYPELHAAEQRMNALATAANAPSADEERVLRQLARELLLAQSSDWAFLIRAGTATDYATQRTRTHLRRFETLANEFAAGLVDHAALVTMEERDNVFPDVDWRIYCGSC